MELHVLKLRHTARSKPGPVRIGMVALLFVDSIHRLVGKLKAGVLKVLFMFLYFCWPVRVLGPVYFFVSNIDAFPAALPRLVLAIASRQPVRRSDRLGFQRCG